MRMKSHRQLQGVQCMSVRGLFGLPIVIWLAAGVSVGRAEEPRLSFSPAARTSFLPLRGLIEWLGAFEKRTSQKVLLRQLIDGQMTYLADSPVPAVEPTRRTGRVRDLIGEEDQDDVNHALI